MKDGEISYLQHAEDWLSHSCHILEIPFSSFAYHGALIEAEQFLWADHDMDPVRFVSLVIVFILFCSKYNEFKMLH